ncbi:MAG: helix-turn-helix transcriptional regulator [Bradyrhizobium sp.]|uniref:TetR/AcrR family transcriptional regulator n=1 Tax=Bradyrhizobium sp. TaxID=376 RepID=UPI0025BA9300|nr:TetR/AcrR family transcriptional regulator [Bradyrhizobium sp.]MBI5264039.1 helix-turn-helix transcriptional regulator [Bradyrhizobium sp.]
MSEAQAKMSRIKPINRRRNGNGHGGRPRADDVRKLNGNILAAAGELFLEHGFDAASMDAIAARARISKRTLYSRFADKSSLFNTVIYDLLGRILVPIETIHDSDGELEAVLLTLARDLVVNALKPELLAVHRVITFETQRRPEFGQWINDTRRKPAIHLIAGILERHRDKLRVADFDEAAEQFANLTFDSCLRLGSVGSTFTPREITDRARAAADLFLAGVRRSATGGRSALQALPCNSAAEE